MQVQNLNTQLFWRKFRLFLDQGNSKKKSYAMAAEELGYIPVRRKNPMFNKPTSIKKRF
jgi:hypothetical protein